jgi:hypothetical protein
VISTGVYAETLAAYLRACTDQNERDYDALVQAEKDGRISVQRGL